MTNPSLIQRPRHITPDAWERASWYARLRLVNTLSQADRAAVEVDDGRRPVAELIAERVESILAERPATLEQIAVELGRKPNTILRRLASAGRRDLADQLQATP